MVTVESRSSSCADARLLLSRCGDLNVSHQSIDLANGRSNTKVAGFTQEEREDFSQVLADGFIDSCKSRFSLKACPQMMNVGISHRTRANDAACRQPVIVDETHRDTALDVTFSFCALA